jgi:selenium metabolism protein YedF
VVRFIESQQFKTAVKQMGSDFLISGTRSEEEISVDHPPVIKKESDSLKIMVMISTNRMGRGDDALGESLMINFVKTLKEMGPELWRLVFVNSGVKLAIDDSSVLEELKELESAGLSILVCGTCLSYFDLLDRKKVGETTNMLDIVTAMQLADKVINL